MTVPSTEELQRLLDKATPGEWRMYDDTDLPKIYGVQTTDGEPICIDGTSQDCQIIQFTCDLAAEVIRLRKENGHLTRIEWLAEQAAESDSGLAYDLDQINREYEGDQA